MRRTDSILGGEILKSGDEGATWRILGRSGRGVWRKKRRKIHGGGV